MHPHPKFSCDQIFSTAVWHEQARKKNVLACTRVGMTQSAITFFAIVIPDVVPVGRLLLWSHDLDAILKYAKFDMPQNGIFWNTS